MSPAGRSKHGMYLIEIEDGRYDRALAMAEKYGLDTDEVYKAQWRRSDFGKDTVQRLFLTVKDLKWILEECLDKICANAESMVALLEYGLSVTQPFVHTEVRESVSGRSDDVWWFSFKRLRLLQYKDRLDTFLAMHAGRFFPKQYAVFREAPLPKIAIKLAEEGRIGSLEWLMKHHLYSLAPDSFSILNSVPETIPPQTYFHLLPGVPAPKGSLTREKPDCVESRETLEAMRGGAEKDELKKCEVSLEGSTEHMVMLSRGLLWPSKLEIIEWYRERARSIDKTSGQLENSLTLLNVGLEKGVGELDSLFEDVSDLYWLVFGTGDYEDAQVDLGLSDWEPLSDFEKFSYMLRGANTLNVIDKLRERAVPFMRRKYERSASARKRALEEDVHAISFQKRPGSLLIEWMRQAAEENKLEICAAVLAEGCKGLKGDWIFEDETELVIAALECVYACKQTDQWSLLNSLLHKLPLNVQHGPVVEDEQPSKGLRGGLARVFRHAGVTKSITMLPISDSLTGAEHSHPLVDEVLLERLRLAEGFVEVGRLLSTYQVHVTMTSLLASQDDISVRKQHLRSLMARFSRRQPPRSDSDWTSLWQDFRILQEKGFLDKEYLLAEFCRGLLKAGKLSLANSYLKGNGVAVLSADQVEKIVLHAAREYFYSASSLDSTEVELARQCLALLPDSETATAEANLLEAVSFKLPALGVNLLPMEFKQMNNRMDIMKRAISARPDSYLNVQELITVARLLGLTSFDDIAEVEVEIARKALKAGDIELTRELCLEVIRNGFSAAWELCAVLGERPELDLDSRREFLEFAVQHCDSVSSEELSLLLTEVNAAVNTARLEEEASRAGILGDPERSPPPSTPSSSSPRAGAGSTVGVTNPGGVLEQNSTLESKAQIPSQESGNTSAFWKRGREYLSKVTKVTQISSLYSTEVVARKKIIGFSCFELPWLVELGLDKTHDFEDLRDLGEDKWAEVTRATYMYAKQVANSSFQDSSAHSHTQMKADNASEDNVLLKLARDAFAPPVSKVGDMVGCGYLLNLADPFMGVQVFEQEWESRTDYREILQLMNMMLFYGQMNDASALNEGSHVGQSSFWTKWRSDIGQKKELLKHAQFVKEIVPDADMRQFASGDTTYIEKVVLRLVECLPGGRLNLLNKVLEVAEFYSVEKLVVLQRYLASLLLSNMLTEEEIKEEVSKLWNELRNNSSELLRMLITNVYPDLDGTDKKRLAYFYELLSDCCIAVKEKGDSDNPVLGLDWQDTLDFQSDFFQSLSKECLNMDSLADELNVKNLVGIDDVNATLAEKEIWKFLDESNIRAFAHFLKNMQTFVAQKRNFGGQFPTDQSIYLLYIKKRFGYFPEPAENVPCSTSELSISALDDSYTSCRMYLGYLAANHLKEMTQALLVSSITSNLKDAVHHEEMMGRKIAAIGESSVYSVVLLWIQAFQDVQMCLSYHDENLSDPLFSISLDEMLSCCKTMARLLVERRVSAKQGLRALEEYVKMRVLSGNANEGSKFLKSMVLAGCSLRAILVVVDTIVASFSEDVHGKQQVTDAHVSRSRSFEVDGSEALSTADSSSARDINPPASRRNVPNLLDVYLDIVDSALAGLKESPVTSSFWRLEELKSVVTSLSADEKEFSSLPVRHGESEGILEKLRHSVWQQLWKYMKEVEHGIHERISVFELLDAIHGKESSTGTDAKNMSSLRWVGWDGHRQNVELANQMEDVSLSRFLSVMRTAQILFRLWPGTVVTEQDLETPDAATSFFLRLEASAASAHHGLALAALMKEWNGIFDSDHTDVQQKTEDGWAGWDDEDDWGEGWQDFNGDKEERAPQSLTVHPLHTCWRLTLQKLFQHKCIQEGLQILDTALENPSKVLVTLDEAKEMVSNIGDKTALSALKLALLLPYDFPRTLALQLVTEEMETGDEDDQDVEDEVSSYESLLALVLSAGLLPSIASNSHLQNIFSILVLVLRRLGQKLQQQRLQEGRKPLADEGCIPLYRLAFPFSVAELTAAKQFEDAGALVLQYMRVSSARATKSAAISALKSYLQTELNYEDARERAPLQAGHSNEDSRRFEWCLKNTMQRLDGQLRGLLEKALETASRDLR